MNSITVSIFVKKNIYAVILIKGGKLYSKEVKRITDNEINSSNYNQMLYTLEVALRKIRNYVENNSDCESFVIELNNSTVINWFDRLYSKEQYESYFRKVVELLEELPIKYMFTYNKKPMAINFAKDEYISKSKLSGLE